MTYTTLVQFKFHRHKTPGGLPTGAGQHHHRSIDSCF